MNQDSRLWSLEDRFVQVAKGIQSKPAVSGEGKTEGGHPLKGKVNPLISKTREILYSGCKVINRANCRVCNKGILTGKLKKQEEGWVGDLL